MASANKTANLGLSQWEAGEGFFREDLNADLAKIDEALGNAGAGCIKPELLKEYDVETPGISILSINVTDLQLEAYKVLWVSVISSQDLFFKFGNATDTEMNCTSGTIFLAFPLGVDRKISILQIGRNSIQVVSVEDYFSKVENLYFFLKDNKKISAHTRLQLWGIK